MISQITDCMLAAGLSDICITKGPSDLPCLFKQSYLRTSIMFELYPGVTLCLIPACLFECIDLNSSHVNVSVTAITSAYI